MIINFVDKSNISDCIGTEGLFECIQKNIPVHGIVLISIRDNQKILISPRGYMRLGTFCSMLNTLTDKIQNKSNLVYRGTGIFDFVRIQDPTVENIILLCDLNLVCDSQTINDIFTVAQGRKLEDYEMFSVINNFTELIRKTYQVFSDCNCPNCTIKGKFKNA